MNDYVITGFGADGAPISPESWKRAVYRAPPSYFLVEMLSPIRQGGNYSYGMRICAIKSDGRSVSSRGSNSEYEVWRRWEDCLWFQDEMELEYARMSRAKRRRLVAGKGVKKNGVYMHGDRASSFESLPPGPDPDSVKTNIHNYIPKLTKKGTFFRPSQATVDQRFQELKACIDGLFQEDVPALIKELRESRKVTDFFGYWRRDFDRAMKEQKSKNPEKQLRHSISSSMFSTYFSTSNPSLAPSISSNNIPASPSYSTTSTSTSTISPRSISSRTRPSRGPMLSIPQYPPSSPNTHSLSSPSQGSSDDEICSRRGSDGSTASSHGPPSPPGSSYSLPSPYIVSHDKQIGFGHNPEYSIAYNSNAALQPLPEDQELISPLTKTRSRKDTSVGQGNRNGQLFTCDETEEDRLSQSMNRLSWQTTTSVATVNPASYLADLDMDLTLPKSPTVASRFPRGSVASFATFMTDSSADAIIPLSSQNKSRRSFSPHSRQSGIMSDTEASPSDDEDLLDIYFNDAFARPSSPVPESRPETPVMDLPSPTSPFSFRSGSTHAMSKKSFTSDSSSTYSSSSSSTMGDSLHIKVVHNTAIILLRAHRSITFEEARAKIYEKFVSQEGVPLSESFALAYLPPAPIDYSKPRSRSGSLSPLSAGFPDLAHMRFISSQRDWENAIASIGRGKLILRSIGDRGV